jgi:FKBP-type peptidyl-prolyl cis-trans isomerase (trigger factor)
MLLLATAAVATATTATVIGLSIGEIVAALVFFLGLFGGLWAFFDNLKKDLHSTLKSQSEETRNNMKEFEERIVNQIREEIKTNISLAESKQEARLAINESKISSHEDELRSMRDIPYRVRQLEAELQAIKSLLERAQE